MNQALKELLADDRRACLGEPMRTFFPAKGDKKTRARAKAICHYCPVTTLCAKAGANEEFGIWGGLTPRERNRRFRPSLDLVPALGSTRRLQALARYGYGPRQVAREFAAADVHFFTVEVLNWIRRGSVMTETERAEAIRELYIRLVERGPNGEPRSVIARKQAAREGWAWPEDWAGLDIDDPDAQPHVIREKAA